MLFRSFTGEQATLLADGRTFDAVAAERLNAAALTSTVCVPAESVSPDSSPAAEP